MIFRPVILSTRDINGPNARKYSVRDTIYVSPSGKDGYLGHTPELPTKRLETVKVLSEKMKNGDPKTINIKFGGGRYNAEEFFFRNDGKLETFKHYEGGNEDYPFVFESIDRNDKAIFDNTVEYSGFVEDGGLWKIKINLSDIRKCNLFGFVNEVRSVPARWPKYGALNRGNITHAGTAYRKCVDSSGFLQEVLDYKNSGGDLRKIQFFASQDFRTFDKGGSITNILSSLSGIPYNKNVFYIPGSFRTNVQFYANQTTIPEVAPPTFKYMVREGITGTEVFDNQYLYNYLYGNYYYFFGYYGLNSFGERDYDNYVSVLTSRGYSLNHVFFPIGFIITDSNYDNYLKDTVLDYKIEYKEIIFWDGVSIHQDYTYKPSNLSPWKVCTVIGENTIIEDGDDYWFYYKPSPRDLAIGIDNSFLRTYNVGSGKYWMINKQSIDYARRDSLQLRERSSRANDANPEIRTYHEEFIKDKYSTNQVGFTIIDPKHTEIKDLGFEFCMTPLSLYTPPYYGVFTTSSPDRTLSKFISAYTTNVTVTGCDIKNSISTGMLVYGVDNLNIEHNLVRCVEGGGINIAWGHNIKVHNNIVVNSQQTDTRKNGDEGPLTDNISVGGMFTLGGHQTQTLSAVDVSNNCMRFAGNNISTAVGIDVHTHHNYIDYGGFGTASDMASVYYGIGNDRISIYNNYIKNSRSDGGFLGSGIYIDFDTTVDIYNNIIDNNITGILASTGQDGDIINNVINNSYQNSIAVMPIQGDIPRRNTYKRNIISPKGGNVYSGWYGFASTQRNISSRICYYKYSTTTRKLYPLHTYNGKPRYFGLPGGGLSNYQYPSIWFDNGWKVGTWSRTWGNTVGLSASDVTAYDYPYQVPTGSWVPVLTADTTYSTFLSVYDGGVYTRSGSLSSENNIFWNDNKINTISPETDRQYLRFALDHPSSPYGVLSSYTNFDFLSGIKMADGSEVSGFGPITNYFELSSKISEPLFYNTSRFELLSDSPAHDMGIQQINVDEIGVYDVPGREGWRELSMSILPQPVIYGHVKWADFKTIPYPYYPHIEYDAPQHDFKKTTTVKLTFNGIPLIFTNRRNLPDYILEEGGVNLSDENGEDLITEKSYTTMVCSTERSIWV